MRDKKAQTELARRLRRQLTDAERALWASLRNGQLQGVKFRRQQPIGPYIVDFISLKRRLILEIDGGQHNKREGKREDRERTEWLQAKGYRVLRFWNNDVLTNMEGVLEKILDALAHPHLTSPFT
jgi:adenine-specific DNA-methyltransferase